MSVNVWQSFVRIAKKKMKRKENKKIVRLKFNLEMNAQAPRRREYVCCNQGPMDWSTNIIVRYRIDNSHINAAFDK